MSEEFKELSVNALVLPKFNVRAESDCAVEMLAQSLKDNGVLQPLLVRPLDDGRYEVICGSRRLQAALKVGLQMVPCKIKAMSDMEAMEAMLVENLQREDLSDYEVGRWFKLLMEKFPDKYPNLQVIAERFGYKDHTQVTRLISHYEFIEKIKHKLPSNIVPRGTVLPEGIVREIRRAPEDLQVKIVKAVCRAFERFERGEIKYAPSVRDVAKLVDSYIMKWKRNIVAEFEKREKAEAPSEEEISARLEEVMRKRREEKQRKHKETLMETLYKYYPENLMKDVESFYGVGAPLDKIQRLAYYTVEVTWYKLSNMYKIEILREVKSWID